MELLSLNETVVGSLSKSVASVARPSGKIRLMVCGTHWSQYNGYSKVIFELFRRLQNKDDLELTLYGFQNFPQTQTPRQGLGSNVTVVDALQLESPARGGFGEKEVGEYLKSHPQDIIIIYNDMSVTSMLAQNIVETLGPSASHKLVSYIDQVYLHQKPRYVQLLNQWFDHIICFTPYWVDVLKGQQLRENMGISVLPHGFNFMTHYPIPKHIARRFFDIPMNSFVVLNLNRNQPRKRWDICMIAFAEVAKMYIDACKNDPSLKKRPIQFLIGTTIQGCWDLVEIYQREVMKRGIPLDDAKSFIIGLSKPQQLSDQDVNVLYNTSDIGLNTCDGEGFGLCNFEQAALGIPQVVPRIGGFMEFLHDDNSLLVEPKWTYYVDNSRDSIGGEAQVSDPIDFAKAIFRYYMDEPLRKRHGERARKDILSHYKWGDIAEHFYGIIKKISGSPPSHT